MTHLWSDPLRHWQQASETLDTGPMTFFDPVMYQLYLSVLQKLTTGLSGLIAFYTIALSCLTPWLWYRVFRELGIHHWLCLVGWMILAWLPSWVAIYSYFMTETLFLPLLGASIWFSLRAQRKATLHSFLLAVFLWTMTALTRGIAAPMAGIALGWIWWGQGQKGLKAAWAMMLALSLLGPVAYRNYQQVGLWSPFGNAWLNRIYAVSGHKIIELELVSPKGHWFYGYGSPSMEAQFLQPISDWQSQRTGTQSVKVDLTHLNDDWQANFDNSQLPDAAWLYWENALFLFAGPSWPDNDPVQALARSQITMRWLWLPLTLIVTVLCARQWRGIKSRPLIAMLIVVWFYFQCLTLLTVNEGRYRKPFEGLLIAQLLLCIDERWRNRFG